MPITRVPVNYYQTISSVPNFDNKDDLRGHSCKVSFKHRTAIVRYVIFEIIFDVNLKFCVHGIRIHGNSPAFPILIEHVQEIDKLF